jgi:heme-degrading monooxygenase HmoA
MPILEIADLRIRPGEQGAFDAAVTHGVQTVISKAKGFLAYRISRGIENPERYVVQILWETVENHTVDFRQSPDYAQWRSIVGPFLAGPSAVEHFHVVSASAW